ncbi:MAG: chorismate mutase, partial [Thermoguttaceae bacterium]
MAKTRASKGKSASAAGLPPVAAEAATKIRQIDAQLLKLIQERAEMVVQAAATRSTEPAAAPGLDDAMLAELGRKSAGPLPQAAIRAIFAEILSGCQA